MATFFDDFSGLTLGSGIPTGYSAASASSSGTVDVVTDATSPGGQSIRFQNISSGERFLSTDQFAATDVQEVAVLVRVSQLDNSALVSGAAVRLSATTQSFYLGHLIHVSSTDQRFQLRERDAGAFTALAQNSGASLYAVDTPYAIRVRADGSNLYAKWWEPANLSDPAADEPASWTLTASDASLGTGLLGFGCEQGGLADHHIMAFGAATAGDTAPLSGSTQLSVPGNFTFTATASTAEVVGAWDTVSGAATYDYEVEEWDGSAWQPFTTGSTTDPTSTFTLTSGDGVEFSTLYRSRVRAVPA